ncbi:MAG TPA: phytanoyl-CoA dioxygenase family protein [Solirubrobacteraceae bacterium]|nr:phytanoyl-CoA dioxygenase family protein [Solirubrobacteraceae bacterium]
MWRFRRKEGGGTATEELPPEATIDWDGTTAELEQEIDRLAAANHAQGDPETERRLLRLRHLAGMRALEEADAHPEFATPDTGALPASDGLPEFRRADLTPGLLRAAILRDGCVLVRGLIDRDAAQRFAERIDRAFAERERDEAGEGLYEEFVPNRHSKGVLERQWIKMGGGVLAADSPPIAFEMLELFRAADLGPLVDGYLGERALISVHKTTLRKATPDVPGAWHQDGAFMGPVRSLNLWLSLSRCGDVAPGLDLVPRRLDDLVATQTDDAVLDMQVSQRMAEQAAGDRPIVRPIFEPGDALLFDELFLHQTASDPSMPNPRYAIENWFFGSSSFPADYAPIAPW